MQDAGIDLIPSNDFSYYDQMLDTIALVGAVPERYGTAGGEVDLDTYFAMARGRQAEGLDVTAMEMTKWFDTNYHYIVPELGPDTKFSLSFQQAIRRARRGDGGARDRHRAGADRPGQLPAALQAGGRGRRQLRPVHPARGPARGLRRGDRAAGRAGRDLGPARRALLRRGPLRAELDALRLAYEELCKTKERPRILVKTYFDHVGDAYGVLRDLPVDGIGLDFTGFIHEEGVGFGDAPFHEHGGSHNVEFVAEQGGLEDKWLFAGIVSGRNVWINTSSTRSTCSRG